MNDIEVLKIQLEKIKDFYKDNRRYYSEDIPCSCPYYILWNGKQAEIVENLINENEKLHKEINQRIKLKIENEKFFDTQCITKDKIKEKIDKLDKMKRKSQIEYSTIDELIFDKKIEVLQELLKGE